MAATDIFNTRADNARGDDIVAPTDNPRTDPYQYANVSRDESEDDERRDVLPSSTGDIPQDIADSARPPPSPAPPPRRQRQAQHHLGVGLSAVVDSLGRRFSESGTPPTHSCINIAVEATATPVAPPPYDGVSSRSSTNETCCRGQHYLFSAICGGINITKERVCIVFIIAIMIVLLVLLEKMIGVDIVDEKKLLQVLATGVLPVREEQLTTLSAPQQRLQ
jgi:hypothetical protein